ncbi:Aminoacyl-tRNA synthetase [Pavlovales sp. CCMP2436]|nr:Aminoacyl-tRNA synthetase [Pavlovales sp. CCMP2436]
MSAPAKAAKGKKEAKPTDEDPGKLAREYVNPTAVGAFKSFAEPIAASYHPHEVEASWNDWWETSGYYTASSDPNDARPKFSICLPPPNVTGSLHLGHALTAAVQDLLIRWHRMKGYNVMWIPGTDHAGIATQSVVEKKLKKEEGKTRHDYGREVFVERVLEWKEAYGSRITMQLRRLGCSLDWSREVFTMDAERAQAVKEAFVTFHERGLLYRGVRLTNWCTQLKSAISDIEVDHIDLDKRARISVPGYDKTIPFGVIWSFAYEFADGSGEIVVSTTRPETLLGDVAIAVHPSDPRYAHCVGKKLIHPFLPEREMRVIADDVLVLMEFGTGAVKVTPAHDPNDFKCGQRNELEMITVFDDNGCMNGEAGEFCGQKRFDCRFAVLAALKEKWWVSCDKMAKRAADAVRSKPPPPFCCLFMCL